ncbi:hypothetical protein bcere0002_23810 [Bacillus cereus ATCC 10876]|uniref:Uncharacterized protein n=1 Tax=Bacillus cereus (strain B4264) TaxID=405532 RepID=B7H5V6_BACC4|nr:hypothetical protein BCB4264_A2644 [Bacillus cereus B4264]AGE78966.1 hypothetical protein HD73_3388 [Bacillus thuringiensis serovar kurstaki str. HD73]AIM31253.1 hypothetical protein DF16_orf02838 [Bacillus thuringiensis serovar kurstaki str. YBT-1520]EEK50563.1 hypothetical protein bcere0002_23810 [Bacillus cereus ATCC 10876]EEK94727.1 hypothetical protein bcere0012_23580 [Bacillus cereus BDRD-ST24]EEL52641.1 hypothetical protein bcere0023_58340 [Bacillus cereus Rock4-2]EEL76301.1 hypothe
MSSIFSFTYLLYVQTGLICFLEIQKLFHMEKRFLLIEKI